MVQLQILAVQTVMPSKETVPRQFLKVTLPDQNLSSILQQRFNIVLCYKKAFDVDSGWFVAGWIKESLGRAFLELPLFAGRLRRNEETGEDWHIVSNDSGVRLVESRVDMDMAQFLGLKDKHEVEGELVFWEDVAEHDPQFSPLFYVQVINSHISDIRIIVIDVHNFCTSVYIICTRQSGVSKIMKKCLIIIPKMMKTLNLLLHMHFVELVF